MQNEMATISFPELHVLRRQSEEKLEAMHLEVRNYKEFITEISNGIVTNFMCNPEGRRYQFCGLSIKENWDIPKSEVHIFVDDCLTNKFKY